MRRPLIVLAVAMALGVAGAALSQYRGELAAPEVEAAIGASPAEFIDTPAGRVHLLSAGDPSKPKLLLLHGINSSAYAWADVAQRLSAQYHVVAVDLPFHGLTGPADVGRCSPGELAEFVRQVMDALGIGSAIVSGSSWGGQIATSLARAYPDRVRQLVLVDASGAVTPPSPLGRLSAVPGAKLLLTRFTSERLVRSTLKTAFANPRLVPDRTIERVVLLNRRAGNREGAFECRRQAVAAQVDAGRVLEDVRVPVHLVWGQQDGWIPLPVARAIAASRPGVGLSEIPEAGHLPMEERPEATAAAMSAAMLAARR